MNGFSSDRNLLLGIVALQMDFISRDALIDAMNSWTLAKSRTLSEILVEKGMLDPADRVVLESLVERHVARHGSDPQESLSSIEISMPARARLESIADPELIESLARLGKTVSRMSERSDPEATGSMAAQGAERAGRFQIVRLHDEGGLGSVFVAMDQELHREVALKQMKEEIAADQASRARFIFEAEITGNLEHPGVVPVYGKGEYVDGRPYYAMRFIHGDNLKDAVDRLHKKFDRQGDPNERRREFQKLLRRFLVVCETMAYAHSRRVIHRDLKPRNILLGPYGETLIVDWGLAKVIGHNETASPVEATLRPPSSSDLRETIAGERRGTPSYMSPEQARGEIDQLGVATDVYSLGSTLYYVLTGRAPFIDQSTPEVIRKVAHGQFLPPREVAPGIDRPIDAICCKAMALRPGDRYASCRLLADDLERWLADLPVKAHAEPAQARAMRWLRRRKQWVAAAAAVLVLAVVGLTFLVWRLGRENERVVRANSQTAEQLQNTRTVLREQLKVAADTFARYPNSEGLRESMVQGILDMYTKLLASYPSDPDILFETAEVYRILGAIRLTTAQIPGSLASFQSSTELFTRLLDHPRRRYDAIRGLVADYVDRGELYRINVSSRLAQEEFHHALDWVEQLRTDPDPSFFTKLKSSALIDRSEVLVLLGRASEAREDADRAVSLLVPPASSRAKSPPNDHTVWLIAMSLTDRGVAAHEMNDLKAAENDFTEAISWLQEIPERSDEFFNRECQKGIALARFGILLGQQQSRRGEAGKQLEKSVDVLRKIAKQSPDTPAYQEELAIALDGRGRLRIAMRLLKDSQQDCEEAETLLTGLRNAAPANPQYLSLLSITKTLAADLANSNGQNAEAKKLQSTAIALLAESLRIDPERVLDRRRYEQLERGAGN